MKLFVVVHVSSWNLVVKALGIKKLSCAVYQCNNENLILYWKFDIEFCKYLEFSSEHPIFLHKMFPLALIVECSIAYCTCPHSVKCDEFIHQKIVYPGSLNTREDNNYSNF